MCYSLSLCHLIFTAASTQYPQLDSQHTGQSLQVVGSHARPIFNEGGWAPGSSVRPSASPRGGQDSKPNLFPPLICLHNGSTFVDRPIISKETSISTDHCGPCTQVLSCSRRTTALTSKDSELRCQTIHSTILRSGVNSGQQVPPPERIKRTNVWDCPPRERSSHTYLWRHCTMLTRSLLPLLVYATSVSTGHQSTARQVGRSLFSSCDHH
jgi:hypothetical protein